MQRAGGTKTRARAVGLRMVRAARALEVNATRWGRGLHDRASRVPVLAAVINIGSAITPLGWFLLVIGGLGTLTGLFARMPEILIPGVGSLALVAAAVVVSLGTSPIAVGLELVSERVQAGEDAPGRLTITNRSTRISQPGLVRFRVGSHVTELWVPRLRPQQRHDEPFIVLTNARGIIHVGPARAVRGDAFGMVRRIQSESEVIDLYVHPASANVLSSAVGFIKDIEGVPTTDLSSSDVSFRALRDYVPGDDRRSIHWRTTARTGRLMVRQFEETRRAHLMVVLDVADRAWDSPAEFELGVSVAASLARAAIGESVIVSIYSQHGVHNSATVVSALDALTTVTTMEDARSLTETVNRATTDTPQASVVFLVTGSTTDVADLHLAMSAPPATMVVSTVRCQPGVPARVSTVGTFKILVVSTLDTLGLTMHRVFG